MESYEFEKYTATSTTLKKVLEEYGVAIIPNVLNAQECNDLLSGIWDYFEHITQDWEKPISRENPLSLREIYKLYPLHSMLFQHFQVGHAQVCWDVRQKEEIVNIFTPLNI